MHPGRRRSHSKGDLESILDWLFPRDPEQSVKAVQQETVVQSYWRAAERPALYVRVDSGWVRKSSVPAWTALA